MARTGENIYKRKDGRWEARYIRSYDNGKALYTSVYGKSYREVKEKVRNRIVDTLLDHSHKDATLGELAEKWLGSKEKSVKESTYATYSRMLESHIFPQFESLLVSKFTTEEALEFHDQLKEKGRVDGTGGLSDKTIADIFKTVHSISKYAQLNNYRVPCDFNQIKLKTVTPKIRILSIEEQEKLVHCLLQKTNSVKLGHLIALSTGLRIGELCGLQWKDIYRKIVKSN